MKYIIKRKAPRSLKIWFDGTPKNKVGDHYNCSFERDLDSKVKIEIKEKLLKEQGYLCCYTGWRIEKEISHIEHILPQSLCYDHEDVDYSNMLAAFPRQEQTGIPFGAKYRGSWFDENLFVTPLQPNCEQRFRFDNHGKIEALESDDAAKETIKRLGLDNEQLIRERKRAIDSVVMITSRPLSDDQLAKLAKGYANRDKNGKYPPFCFVIQQVAKATLEARQQEQVKAHKRKVAISKQSKQKQKTKRK